MKGWGIVFILLVPLSHADILITEVFSNPPYDESLNEWIEIYNNGSAVNLSNYFIGDGKENDSIVGALYNEEGVVLGRGEYAIITDEQSRVYHNFNITALALYLEDSSFGRSGLSNSGGSLYLFSNTTLVSEAHYPKLSDGQSYQLLNNSWIIADPNPGNAKKINNECEWELHLKYNLTTYYEDGDLRLQLIALKEKGDQAILNSSLTLLDMYGKPVREYLPFSNHLASRQKSSSIYNPTIDTTLPYLVSSNLSTNCSSPRQQEFWVLPQALIQQENSVIDAEKIYDLGSDHIAAYGQSIRVKFHVYKGDTRKEVIKIWAEQSGSRISKQTKVNVKEKYSNHTFTVPIQLYPNCKEKYEKGSASVVVDGLDTADRIDFAISGITQNLCERIEVEKKPKRARVELLLLDSPGSATIGHPFESLIEIRNHADSALKAQLWSYVYRGSKKYSGYEKKNLRYLTLLAGESVHVSLPLVVFDAQEGDYQLKVKLQREGRKTAQEITEEIFINVPRSQDLNVSLKNSPKPIAPLISGAAVMNATAYESDTFSNRALTPYLLGALLLFSVVFAWIKH